MLDVQEGAKSQLLDRAGRSKVPGVDELGMTAAELGAFLTAYYRHVAPDDLLGRTPEDLLGAAASEYRQGQTGRKAPRTSGCSPQPFSGTDGPPRATPWSRSSPTTCRSWSTR